MSADPSQAADHAVKHTVVNTHRLAAFARALYAAYGRMNMLSRRLVGVLGTLLLLAYFIFSVLFLTLRYAILPHIEEYKGTIERVASRAIGNRVTIATIDASWDGLRPRLALGDVVIHDRSGQAALRLPQVTASLSWESVLVGDVRFYTLLINRPDLSIRRDADGRIFVAGIALNADQYGNAGIAWLLAQREIIIRDGRVSWNDQQRGAPQLVLQQLDFVLRNQWFRHRMALKAVPPASLAAPLDVRADFRHPVFAADSADVSRWSGVLYGDVRDTDLALWKAYLDFPFVLERATGSIRAWLTLDQLRVADFTADLSMHEVSAQLGPRLLPLQLASVAGRISGTEPKSSGSGAHRFGANGHSISLQNFSLQTSDGLRLPPTTISETFVPAAVGRAERFSISAQLLDLQILSNLAERLPLSSGQRQLLSDLAPRGQLQDLSAQWEGSYPEIASYRLKTAFRGLALKAQAPHAAHDVTASHAVQAAMPGIPGFENLSGQIDLTEKSGTLKLAAQQLTFQLPGYFSDPALPFDRLNLVAHWNFEQHDALLLRIDRMNVARQGLAASISGTYLFSLLDDRPGISDLRAQLSYFDVSTIDRYLPLQTPDVLRSWLSGALLKGNLRDATLRLQGDLAHFPFSSAGDKAKGQFSVAGKFDGLTMNYTPQDRGRDGKSPEWPLLEQGQGSILFDRARLAIHADTARSNNVALSNVSAEVADLHADASTLVISGNAAGSMQNLVGYVNLSPVAGWIDDFTEDTKASGDGRLQMRLVLPLDDVLRAKVSGTLQFLNNDVTLLPLLPTVYRTHGKLTFNEAGFSLNGVKGQFLNAPLSVSGGTQADKTTLVNIDGGVAIEGLRRAYPQPEILHLLDQSSGSARYKASIALKNHATKIIVESNLQGIGLALPAPLGKEVGAMLPLKFEMNSLPLNPSVALRDDIRLSVGNVIDARYLLESALLASSPQTHPLTRALPRVISAGIGINRQAVMPDSGVLMDINSKVLDIDQWRRFIGRVSPSGQGVSEAGSLFSYLQPDVLAVRANELIVMGRTLNNVQLGASHKDNAWQVNLDSTQVAGHATWSEARPGVAQGKVSARLTRLDIPQSAASSVGELLVSDDAATEMPALDIIADDFHLLGKSLGRLALVAENLRTNAGREWRIGQLSIINPDAELKASGNWMVRDHSNTSHLTYALDIHDAGKLLSRFGFNGMVRGGHGLLDGDVTWNGLPFAFDIPSLSGNIHIDVEKGQFLKVDPGAGKLLGVLNLQALPRRMTLDFRDVFSDGFVFDRLFGSASIGKGMASTDNLKMTSVAATVLLSGEADIARETQQLNVVVIPEFNLGTASLVALAINPVVGVSTFLAQLFLRNPLMQQFTFEYNVAGSWANPVVTKLPKRSTPDK